MKIRYEVQKLEDAKDENIYAIIDAEDKKPVGRFPIESLALTNAEILNKN